MSETTSRFLRPGLCAAAALLLIANPALGQRPLPLGTAAGHGLGGMTEARFAEAALWNPALAGIFDGPMASFSALGIAAEVGQANRMDNLTRSAFKLSSADSLDRIHARSYLGQLGPSEAPGFRGAAAIQWAGVHSRDLLISLSSQLYAHVDLPVRTAEILRGENNLEPISEADIEDAANRWVNHSLTTTLAAAKGADLGILPVLGRAWAGIGVKATYLHSHEWGQFGYVDAESLGAHSSYERVSDDAPEAAAVYRGVGLSSGRIYGVDFGLVVHPTTPLLLSVAVANVYQKSDLSIKEGDLYARNLAFVQDAQAQPSVVASKSHYIPEEFDPAYFGIGEYTAEASRFMPVVRVGGSLDTAMGRLTGGYALPLDDAPALDRNISDRYSMGIQFPMRTQPRVSYTRRFDDSEVWRAGLQTGFCADRIALSGGTIRYPEGTQLYTVDVSWSRGSGPCGAFRRP